MRNNLFNAFKSKIVLLAVAALPLSAIAGPGHDHGEAAPKTGVSSLPRFSAVSDEFELVGVLDGKKITIFLDRADTNEAIKQANIELQLGGTKVKLNANVEGAFVAELAAPLKEGVTGVIAAVTVGQETDLLAGELDLHLDNQAAHVHPTWSRWQIAGGVIGGLVLAAMLLAMFQRARRNKNQSKYSGGAI